MKVRLVQKLKKTHPQKYWLKMICKYLYYLGLGDCWYESRPYSSYQKYYWVWAVTANSYMITFFINEMLAHFRHDLTVKEQNDSVQFSIAHMLIFAKIVVFYFRKDRIRVILERLLEGERPFLSSKLDEQSVKTALVYCLAIASDVCVTLSITLVDAVQTRLKEGIPVRTEVSFFPRNSDTGVFINILRFVIEFHFWYLVSVMILIDGISIFSLTFSGFKFRSVRMYFESLGERFSKSVRLPNVAEVEEFWRDFVGGIELHEDALWCAKNVQHALGDIYSVQIVESILLLVICLIKLVSIERNFMLVLANLGFTAGLVVVTGAYMMVAAEITHEASLVSTAIFHCGWELVRPAGRRALVVIALQRSQVQCI